MTTTPSSASVTPGKIAVAVDGSDDSQRALRYALKVARAWHRDLLLVHVPIEAPPLMSLGAMAPIYATDTVQKNGQKFLDTLVANLQDEVGNELAVAGNLGRGNRTAGILEAAAGAALIVLGTRSSQLRRVLTGSTTTGVAGRAECAVTCVPSGWDEYAQHGRVVAAVDGSPSTGAVLRTAAVTAQRSGAAVQVLHAWQPTPSYDDIIEATIADGTWQRESDQMLAELSQPVRDEFTDVEFTLEASFTPTAETLVEASRHADQIVMGRRDERSTFGLALGSVSRALISHAACPVVIVPSGGALD